MDVQTDGQTHNCHNNIDVFLELNKEPEKLMGTTNYSR